MPQSDLPLAELRRYSPDPRGPVRPGPVLGRRRWRRPASTISPPRSQPIDNGLSGRLDARRHVTRASAGHRSGAGCTCRPIGRVLSPRWSSTSAMAADAACRTSGSCGRPPAMPICVMDTRGQGSTWAVGDTPDPDSDWRPVPPGLHDPGHPGSSDLLLPPRLHRCGPGGRGGPGAPAGRSGAGSR